MRPIYLYEREAPAGARSHKILFVGDPHIGHWDRGTRLLENHLDYAVKENAQIVLWGDLRDWIVPTDRKRFDSHSHAQKVSAYLNLMIDETAHFLAPYANNIMMLKVGNHETSTIKYSNLDPIALLVQRLNSERYKWLDPIVELGYTGWLRIRLTDPASASKSSPSVGAAHNIWMHHGVGGASPVTKGAIDRARIRDHVDADTYMIGHKHNAMYVPWVVESVNTFGIVERSTKHFVQLPGYSGWERENMSPNEGYNLNWSGETFYGIEAMGSYMGTFSLRRLSKKVDDRPVRQIGIEYQYIGDER